MKNISCLFVFLFIGLSFSLNAQRKFTEVSEAAGINHAFRIDLSNFGGGAVVFDYDNDGYEDLYLPGGNEKDQFYRNNGDGTFTNIFEGAGFDRTLSIHTQGAAAADIDRDGDKDLIITTLYFQEGRQLTPNLLYLNNGDGTFSDVTRQYGLEEYISNSQGATFGDINADGFPDLYIANYIGSPPNGVSVFNEQTITENFLSATDYLFINAGGSYFIEASDLYGIDHNGFGFQGILSDWDNDQDVDIMIANDFGYKAEPNIALRNDFPERSLTYRTGELQLNYGMNAMGFGKGDYNYDGFMDYYVTNIHASLFVQNNGGNSFSDLGADLGIAQARIQNPNYSGVPVSWGANFFDYDHDTDLDLFVNNGALNPDVRPNPNFFFECSDYAIYREVANLLGVDDVRIGRGSVTFDYDNDGDLDLLVVNQYPRDEDPTGSMPPARTLLYRNNNTRGNWLKVKLEGVKAEKDGIGSRIEIQLDDRLLIRDIDGGSSHLSQNSTIAHFGLGQHETVRSVKVRWTGGKTQEITNVAANQQITIRETEESIFSFDQNDLKVYPSSFNDYVLIEYELEKEEPFDISVYDVQGRLIETLSQQNNPAKTGFWQWNIERDLAQGVYIFQLRTKNSVIAKRALKL